MLCYDNLKKGFKMEKAKQWGKKTKGEELRKQEIEIVEMLHNRETERKIYQEKTTEKKEGK